MSARPPGLVAARRAVRTDRVSHIAEEVGYLRVDGDDVIVHLYRPEGPPSGAVVVCCSVHGEFVKNYRREVLLARAVAARGVAVARFHYRGTGNSGGRHEPAYPSMRADARAVADWVETEVGSRPAVMGTRLGALVAAATSKALGAPLVMWQPPTAGSQYFADAFRAQLMTEMKKRGDAPARSRQDLLDELARDGSVDVLGYALTRDLYDSVVDLKLDDEVGTSPRPLLLVQVERAKQLAKPFALQADAWRAGGFAVETAHVPEDEAWWFVGDDWQAEEQREGTTALIEMTSDWLVASLGAGRS